MFISQNGLINKQTWCKTRQKSLGTLRLLARKPPGSKSETKTVIRKFHASLFARVLSTLCNNRFIALCRCSTLNAKKRVDALDDEVEYLKWETQQYWRKFLEEVGTITKEASLWQDMVKPGHTFFPGHTLAKQNNAPLHQDWLWSI